MSRCHAMLHSSTAHKAQETQPIPCVSSSVCIAELCKCIATALCSLVLTAYSHKVFCELHSHCRAPANLSIQAQCMACKVDIAIEVCEQGRPASPEFLKTARIVSTVASARACPNGPSNAGPSNPAPFTPLTGTPATASGAFRFPLPVQASAAKSWAIALLAAFSEAA